MWLLSNVSNSRDLIRKIVDFPNIPGRPVDSSTVDETIVDKGVGFEIAHGTTFQELWTAGFGYDGSGMLNMRTRNTDAGGVNDDRTFAFLKRQGAESVPPALDKNLLRMVRTEISPYWPAQRKSDAAWFYKAVSAL